MKNKTKTKISLLMMQIRSERSEADKKMKVMEKTTADTQKELFDCQIG